MQNPWMNLALKEAESAYDQNEVPVGAVIVRQQKIVSKSHNLTISACDPTAHAEIIAIREACIKLSTTYLIDCDIYVTLEPCPMCAQAISNARIKNVYFGATDLKSGGVISGPQIYTWQSAHHKPNVYSGIMEEDSSSLLQHFFKEKR
ncbi:MAG: nucleoside deaminase [Alphaproteobacteria bacterium]|jgi:tRNA(Arg) A34 adenosine deaminase TadA